MIVSVTPAVVGGDLAGRVLVFAERIGRRAAEIADWPIPVAPLVSSCAETAMIVQRDAVSMRHWPVVEQIWQPPQGAQAAPFAPHCMAVRMRTQVGCRCAAAVGAVRAACTV